jgi:hypothetical protein
MCTRTRMWVGLGVVIPLFVTTLLAGSAGASSKRSTTPTTQPLPCLRYVPVPPQFTGTW